MIYYLSRYLTDPPYTLSEQLTSHIHPPLHVPWSSKGHSNCVKHINPSS